MNLSGSEDDNNSWPVRFWESTKRAFRATKRYLANLMGCKLIEDEPDNLGPPRSNRIVIEKSFKLPKSLKSTKIRDLTYSSKKSIEVKSVGTLKVMKSSSKKSLKSLPQPKKVIEKAVEPQQDAIPNSGIDPNINTDFNVQDPTEKNDVKFVPPPKPDSIEVRKIKKSNSKRKLGIVFEAQRRKSCEVRGQKGIDGKIKSPGVPTTSTGPGGRVIRLTFLTGFPKLKSDRTTKTTSSDEFLKEKNRKSVEDGLPEPGLDIATPDELPNNEVEIKDSGTQETLTKVKSTIKSNLNTTLGVKDDTVSVAKDALSENPNRVQKSDIFSAPSVRSVISEHSPRKT